MGNSLPPPAAIDLVGSYARRHGDDVKIVLWDPQFSTRTSVLVLEKGRGSVRGRVELIDEASGRCLVGHVPRGSVTDGIWSIALRPDSGDDEPVDARLLVQGDRPLVLLWGAKTKPSAVPPARPAAAARKRRAAAKAGRAVDVALRVLPPDRATKVRSTMRKTARKVLS